MYYFGVSILALFIVVNMFIILTGRWYLYKGIANTYLIGKTGPGIYDLKIFPFREIESSDQKESWDLHPNYNEYRLSKKEKRLMRHNGTQAFLVIKDGQIVYEKFWGEHDTSTVSNSFSAAKTIVSMLVGIAIKEGKIQSIDEPVGNYLPAYSEGEKSKITLRHLLYMASGLEWGESGANPLSHNAESYYGNDLERLVYGLDVVAKPNEMFLYQSGNSQLLGFILEKATGMKISDYAQEKLWDKIGAEHKAYWSLDRKNGNEKAFCCWYAAARDFAKLGQLMANKGVWNGQEVIPKSYFETFVQPADLTTEEGIPNTRYGLHVWLYYDKEINRQVVYCRGILGQYVAAIPEENLVFVRLGHRRLENVMPEDLVLNKYNEGTIGHPKDFFDYLKLAKRIAGVVK